MRSVVFLVAACAWGQGLNRPQLGVMLDSSGGARSVLGLPGSLSVADPSMTGVVSLGCAAFCFIKTDTSLMAQGQTLPAPVGSALFAFDSSSALVYFSGTRQLAQWQAGQLTPVDYNVTGEILSIQSSNGAVEFVSRVRDEIRVVRDGDAVMYTFPRGTRTVMLVDDGYLFSTADAIVLHRADSTELNFPLAGVTQFLRMASDYVEVRAANHIYALRTTAGSEELFELPEPRQTQPALSLMTFNGTTETPVGATFNYGNIASGASSAVRFRVFNNTTSPITVYGPVVSGVGFTISAINGTPPVAIPPDSTTLNFFEFSVTFAASGLAAGTYSASLEISGPSTTAINVLLLASVPGTGSAPGQPPALTVLSGAGCSPSGTTGVNFAPVNIGSQGLCNFTLTNPNSFAITISSLSVSGDSAFSVQQAPTFPLSLAGNMSTSFTLQIAPVCGQATYTGTLTINSSYYSSPFSLSGNGITPALPTPTLNLSTQSLTSGQNPNPTIAVTLPSASACGANGYLNLAFTPAPNLPVADDSTIVFTNGSVRTLPFSVAPGSSQVLINGSASPAAFQTGSTAGTISFSLSGVSFTGTAPVASYTIAPAPVYIDSATASNQATGQLNITVVGYDNTYSTGQMTFTFYDGSGQVVGQPISANFTSNFASFYSGQQMGSTFLMQVSFPVLGSCVPSTLTTCTANQVIATVQATLTNSAGQTQTGTLTFQ